MIPDEVYNKLSDEEKAVVKPYHYSYNQEWMRQTWSDAIAYAKSKGLTLYLGEFGCMVNCGENIRLAWLKDVVDLARQNNIPYALWEYSAQFGFADRWNKGKITNQALMDVLVK